LKLVYLGTSGAMPAVERGLSCTVLAMDKEYIMVDCGDGSCRQYVKSNLKWNKPMTILFTHMHSDHTIGILGLLQSMDLVGRTEPVTIYGIGGISKFITQLHRNQQVKFGYDFNVIDIDEDFDLHLKSGVRIQTCKTKHSIKPSLAYKITLPDKEGTLGIDRCIQLGVTKNSPLLGMLKKGENVETGKGLVLSKDVVGKPTKGKVIGFSGDTRPTPELTAFFKGADFLTYETTFRSDELSLAIKAKHSTAEEAGKLAQEAGVGTLLCNHFSARHANVDGFKTDIKEHYGGRVILTKDFLEVDLD